MRHPNAGRGTSTLRLSRRARVFEELGNARRSSFFRTVKPGAVTNDLQEPFRTGVRKQPRVITPPLHQLSRRTTAAVRHRRNLEPGAIGGTIAACNGKIASSPNKRPPPIVTLRSLRNPTKAPALSFRQNAQTRGPPAGSDRFDEPSGRPSSRHVPTANASKSYCTGKTPHAKAAQPCSKAYHTCVPPSFSGRPMTPTSLRVDRLQPAVHLNPLWVIKYFAS